MKVPARDYISMSGYVAHLLSDCLLRRSIGYFGCADAVSRQGEESEEGQRETQGDESKRRTLLDVAREKEMAASPEGKWRQYWDAQYGAALPRSEQYLPTMPTRETVVGEVLHIIRPLIYGTFACLCVPTLSSNGSSAAGGTLWPAQVEAMAGLSVGGHSQSPLHKEGDAQRI